MSSRADVAAPGTASERQDGSPGDHERTARMLALAGLLAAAWLIPIAAQALRADWVLLIVLLLGTGSLLRAGYCLLDRLMLAWIVLAGTLITGGLLFSLWPWGLQPVPVTGTILTALIAVGALTGRRPRLPLRFRGTDAIIVGAGALAAWMMLGPVAGRSFHDQLPFTTGVEDKYAHFALFDAIHRLGGYTFLHPARASALVTTSTAHVYPQGSHYLYAVLDIFLRSATGPGPTPAEFSRYFSYTLVGFGFLVLAVTWSARWVAGPAMTGWRRAFVCSAVATLVTVGPVTGLIKFAFDSETVGLALLALTVAVTARPAGRPREQVLLVASALIAVWYAYNLYGALAGLAVIPAVVAYRHRLRRHWLFTAITAGISAPVALLPSALAELSGFSANRQLMTGGDIIPLNWYLLAGLALLACASLAVRAGRRSGAWRVQTAQVVLAAVAIAILRIYQQYSLDSSTDYYFAKVLTGAYVICLVGFGAAGLLLGAAGKRAADRPPARGLAQPAGGLAQPARGLAQPARGLAQPARGLAQPAGGLAQPLASAVAGLAAVILAGGLLLALPGVRDGHSDYTEAWAYRWWSGQDKPGPGTALRALDRAHLLADGTPTLVIFSNVGLENWRASFFAAVLNRDLSAMKGTFQPLLKAGPMMDIDKQRFRRARLDYDIAIIERAIAHGPQHLSVIVSAPGLAARLRSFATEHPGLDLTVRHLPQMRAGPLSRRHVLRG